MDANLYQKKASRTLIDKPDFLITDHQVMVVWCLTGLCGEAGEIAKLIKKGIFHQHGVDKQKLRKEIGDVLWYIAGICTVFDFNLGDIMQENINKLNLRYPNGYNTKDSVKRVDVYSEKPASKFEEKEL